MVKVPADVAFTLAVTDANGRRITQRHQNWLQVRPGEELKCNGCHDRNSGLSHGRSDAFAPAHDGATAISVPYPNTDPTLFVDDFGETMAEVRARVSCSTNQCDSLQPSVDVLYRDVWTDETAAGRQADPDITLSYGDLLTPRPVSPACEQSWTASCRTVLHYEDHIHPLWSLPRVTTDMNGNVISDFTCISCHSDRDAQNQLRVPLGQLDLSDGLAPNVQDQLEAFRELLFGDVELELNMGALQPRLVQVGTDPVTGDPILDTVPVAPSMSGAGANASQRFFSRFAPGGTHAGYLSDAELRLLSEWLDIGAQYYNDPFRVPQN